MATLSRGGVVGERRAYPCRAVEQFAAAIGAMLVECVGAFSAEGALERTDGRARRIGGKIGAAAFAIEMHGEHGRGYSGLGRRLNRVDRTYPTGTAKQVTNASTTATPPNAIRRHQLSATPIAMTHWMK